jgi:serine/threonine protein kinase
MIGQLLVERYLILERLGTGGFSETYLARDKYLPRYPLCVVKRLPANAVGSLSPQEMQHLFATEAAVLDQLQHDQIPTLLAYCQEPEQRYLVQSHVPGETLATWPAMGKRLSAAGAIALLANVLPILHSIHSRGVIHQDVTPGNLICRQGDRAIVLIDFGAARIVSPEFDSEAASQAASEAASEASSRHAIGTPGYMPPEQEAGQSQFNSDLYALGLVVIHLLTGVEPVQLAVDPISGELDWQSHWPDGARHPSLVALLDALVRRQVGDRCPDAETALAQLDALLPKNVRAARPQSSRWFVAPSRPVLSRLLRAGVAATAIGAGGLYLHSHPGQAPLGLPPFQAHAGAAPLTRLQDLPTPAPVQQMQISPNSQVLVTAGMDRAVRLWAMPTGKRMRAFMNLPGTVTAMGMSRDSRLLVCGSSDNTIRLWDMTTGRLLWSQKPRLQPAPGHRANPALPVKPQGMTAVAISPDGKTVISGGSGGELQLWDVATGDLLKTVKGDAAITAVAYGARSQQVISAGADQQISVWNLRTGKRDRQFTGHTDAIVSLQSISPETFMSVGQDRSLVWNIPKSELVSVFPAKSASPVAVDWNGQTVLSVHTNGAVRLWRPDGSPVGRPVGSPGGSDLGRSPQAQEIGKLHLTAGASERSRSFPLLSPASVHPPSDPRIALSPNHRYVVCWQAKQPLRIWQLSAAIGG